jgi:hypothetical protein
VVKGHASPYATGGGGVVLEHAYGGSLLACLLQQGPVGGLGDDVLPVEVRFQRGASYPVDDLMVIGQSRAGERRLFVGVRRSPVIGAGSASFVSLLADYVRMVVDDPAKFEADDWRLGLAVAAPHAASAEVRTLAWIARRQRDNAAFRAAVAAPQATKRKIRVRLGCQVAGSQIRILPPRLAVASQRPSGATNILATAPPGPVSTRRSAG